MRLPLYPDGGLPVLIICTDNTPHIAAKLPQDAHNVRQAKIFKEFTEILLRIALLHVNGKQDILA